MVEETSLEDISEGLRELPIAVFYVDHRGSRAYHDYIPDKKLEILKPSTFLPRIYIETTLTN